MALPYFCTSHLTNLSISDTTDSKIILKKRKKGRRVIFLSVIYLEKREEIQKSMCLSIPAMKFKLIYYNITNNELNVIDA